MLVNLKAAITKKPMPSIAHLTPGIRALCPASRARQDESGFAMVVTIDKGHKAMPLVTVPTPIPEVYRIGWAIPSPSKY